MWLKMFFKRLLRKKAKAQPEKEFIPPELPSYEPRRTTKQRLEGLERYCEEIRKDLWIKKKTDDRLYVEMGNLKSKIERFLEKRESK